MGTMPEVTRGGRRWASQKKNVAASVLLARSSSSNRLHTPPTFNNQSLSGSLYHCIYICHTTLLKIILLPSDLMQQLEINWLCVKIYSYSCKIATRQQQAADH